MIFCADLSPNVSKDDISAAVSLYRSGIVDTKCASMSLDIVESFNPNIPIDSA